VTEPLRYQIRCAGLPLAVYREVAAHLRQVGGVEVGLIPQTSRQFDYQESQIGGLWLEYALACPLASRERVKQILAYYQSRYGVWEEDTTQVVSSKQGLEAKS
jgi:hypothetical protein